jgi:2-iminobutanoate/2-iminopropanoate deaminase
MYESIASAQLYDESSLFLAGARAGELTFVSQDARGPDGSLADARDSAAQARRTMEHLDTALRVVGQDLRNAVSLLVLLTDYGDLDAVAAVIDGYYAGSEHPVPATCFLGVTSLEGGCRVRIDAVTSDSRDRAQILAPGVPLARGSRGHGVRVGDLFFLSGIDAGEDGGRSVERLEDMGAQTTAMLNRAEAVLQAQGLHLGDILRTWMFMSDLRIRPGYSDARREKYQGIFRPDEYPANSGIGIQALGTGVLIRCVAIATRDRGKQYVSSDKVRLTPELFSQSVGVGNWLFMAGQDSIGMDHQTLGIDDIEEQTWITLIHLKDVVEAAGGTVDDILKTTTYLVEGQDRVRFAATYRRFFQDYSPGKKVPAGLTLGVKGLAPDCLVEIDAVAYLGPRG